MDCQSYWRYWTLFCPKYCARAGATTPRPATAASAATAMHRRPQRLATDPRLMRPSPDPAAWTSEYRPIRSRFAESFGRILVLPARLEIDVEVRGPAHARGRSGRGPLLGELAGHVEEPVEPVLGLEIALDHRLVRDGRVAPRARKHLLVAQHDLVSELRAESHHQRPPGPGALLAPDLPVGEVPAEGARQL